MGSHGVFLQGVLSEVFDSPKNKGSSVDLELQRCHFKSPEQRTEDIETVKRGSKEQEAALRDR